jgi:hypothetical protein
MTRRLKPGRGPGGRGETAPTSVAKRVQALLPLCCVALGKPLSLSVLQSAHTLGAVTAAGGTNDHNQQWFPWVSLCLSQARRDPTEPAGSPQLWIPLMF